MCHDLREESGSPSPLKRFAAADAHVFGGLFQRGGFVRLLMPCSQRIGSVSCVQFLTGGPACSRPLHRHGKVDNDEITMQSKIQKLNSAALGPRCVQIDLDTYCKPSCVLHWVGGVERLFSNSRVTSLILTRAKAFNLIKVSLTRSWSCCVPLCFNSLVSPIIRMRIYHRTKCLRFCAMFSFLSHNNDGNHGKIRW